jgi:uncharacterized membrane protein
MSLVRKQVINSLITLFALTVTVTAFGQDGRTSGKCTFQPLKIGAPAGINAFAGDINDAGAIVGTANASGQPIPVFGFLASRGKFVQFRFPGTLDTLARDINNHGVIVGSFDSTAFSGQRAFLVHSGGFHQIQIPGFPNAPATADAINDHGDIAGSFNGNDTNFGYLLHKGHLTVLSFPGARGGTFPLSINDQRTIVGVYRLNADSDVENAFIWKNGVFSNLTSPGGLPVRPTKINNEGDIVGTFIDANLNEHGFSLDKGRFSIIDAPGALGTALIGLNNRDNVLAVAAGARGNTQLLGACSRVF